MSSDRNGEPFLSRWSRQKRSDQQTAPPVSPETEASPALAEPPVDLSKLPDIDDLTAQSDITGFLQKGVPEALQRMALRKMWSLEPAIRDFVEIAENQWDFNAPGGIPGLFQDIAPGTDMSVWLAQATQSVPTGDADVTSSEPAQVASPVAIENAASQHEKQVAAPSQLEPSALGTRTANVEAGSGANQIQDRAVEPVTARPTQRRRHGGALPSDA